MKARVTASSCVSAWVARVSLAFASVSRILFRESWIGDVSCLMIYLEDDCSSSELPSTCCVPIRG
ncbi:hypothetical protein BJX66DRAFT_310547 [Aspergillus keveii]|uniref:Secreted protein n=1 Tax=Aspergillus keveii TaxID=714993 RepID=A0ABR4FXF5_9EURO